MISFLDSSSYGSFISALSNSRSASTSSRCKNERGMIDSMGLSEKTPLSDFIKNFLRALKALMALVFIDSLQFLVKIS
jgi:hypothetical protein